MKNFGIIAYYATSFEGEQLKPLFIDVDGTNIKDIRKVAKNNETSFPNGQLIRIELIPKVSN